MTPLTLLLGVAAFALFGIATPAHHARRIGGPVSPRHRRRFRLAAWLATAACFPAALMARGWIFGPVLWLGALIFGAAAAFLLLNLLPDRARTGKG